MVKEVGLILVVCLMFRGWLRLHRLFYEGRSGV